MELGLVVEAHGAGHVPREVDVVDELGVEAGGPRGGDLVAQLVEVARVLRVGEGGAAAEVAVDRALGDAGGDQLEARGVRLGVVARALLAEVGAHLVVDEPVQHRDLGGRVARHAGRDAIGLEHRDRAARRA